MRTTSLVLALLLAPAAVSAHHSPVVYDGKRTVEITGTVTYARFGYPHSRYRIEVAGGEGAEEWLLMTEDPRDAERLGFADALKAIGVGDTITVVGWPHKAKPREIRGHQLHYPDGTVVMMRRGNYIWTADLRRIWRLRDGQVPFSAGVGALDPARPAADRVIAWIEEDSPVERVAWEILHGSAGLVGIDRGEGYTFPGVREDFACHTERDDFRIEVDARRLDPARRAALDAGAEYLAEFNDLMATYWEYDIASCP